MDEIILLNEAKKRIMKGSTRGLIINRFGDVVEMKLGRVYKIEDDGIVFSMKNHGWIDNE